MSNLEILFSDEFRRTVEENLGRDPVRIALDKKLPHASIVASQVKYLQRARRKLPSYYEARCVIPPLAFEQSSSEETAARKNYSGGLCIDLTCGLGVDSLWLSKKFRRVISVERNPELAAMAHENFRRLGAENIEVVNSSAEEFLAGFAGAADLVYADPDRRGAKGKKMVRIEDCSPDIAALMPQLRRIAPRLVVKLSPLFDVDEVFRVFGTHARAEVVSLGGECKEIVAEVSGDIENPAVAAVAIGLDEAEYTFAGSLTSATSPSLCEGTPPYQGEEFSFSPQQYRWLVVPDVALQKGRLAQRYFSERGFWIDSDNGYAFSTAEPVSIMGKALEIKSMEPFDPKDLKRRLKESGVKNIDILKRNFPLSSADIARQLGVREGGHTAIAFTRAAGKMWQIVIQLGIRN